MFSFDLFSFKLVLIATVIGVISCAFPSNIPRCHAGDVECVTQTSMNLIRKYAKTGYPEVGFPKLEPFFLEKFDITDGSGRSVNLKLNFRDLLVGGLSDVTIDRAVGFTSDPRTSKFEMYGSFSKLTLRGKYHADGRILILPIQGDGDADISLIKPKISIKFKPIVNVKNGMSFLDVGKLKVLIEPERVNIKLTNLFNGDKNLGENLNQFLYNNWSDVWAVLQPSIHSAITEIVKNVASNIFKKFSYEEIYLD